MTAAGCCTPQSGCTTCGCTTGGPAVWPRQRTSRPGQRRQGQQQTARQPSGNPPTQLCSLLRLLHGCRPRRWSSCCPGDAHEAAVARRTAQESDAHGLNATCGHGNPKLQCMLMLSVTCAHPAAPPPAAAAAGQQGCQVDTTSSAARTAKAVTLQPRHPVAAAPPLQRCQTCR